MASTASGPANDEDDSRPIILCLHGGGSTATVFKIQCRRLIWTLGSQFKFVFAIAPHEGDPGHGMLPVFESCAPFYRWVTRKWKLGEGDTESTPSDEIDLVDESLDAAVRREAGDAGWQRVVGVIGFSQGARLVGGLLLRQKLWEREHRGAVEARKWNLKFGVMVGGPYPPIALSETVDPADYALLKEVPTVHAWGIDDHVKSGCEQMRAACEGDVCFDMDFKGGHHMPLTDVEAKDLCDLILAAWYAGGGSYGVAQGQKY
ncbi:Esterase LovG [Cyphellophora attinorum]|uniref:Esterase LovG n=1 Tax=Cyphellophora attinorum TaxID=1664694 RepID=A0A0N1HTM9_9EURO|nr:Esterase LovG [Phialophora attinorum]KPI42443.1 Esterase LovG [Phialophora attinorum]